MSVHLLTTTIHCAIDLVNCFFAQIAVHYVQVINMIECRLRVILAEKNLKISKVAADTGISRTTLHALSGNYGQGVQYDTLNKLCEYLRITPGDLYEYHPVSWKIENNCVYIEILVAHEKTDVILTMQYTEQYSDSQPEVVNYLHVSLSFFSVTDDDKYRDINALYQIPPSLFFYIEEDIVETIKQTDGYSHLHSKAIEISWPPGL